MRQQSSASTKARSKSGSEASKAFLEKGIYLDNLDAKSLFEVVVELEICEVAE